MKYIFIAIWYCIGSVMIIFWCLMVVILYFFIALWELTLTPKFTFYPENDTETEKVPRIGLFEQLKKVTCGFAKILFLKN